MPAPVRPWTSPSASERPWTSPSASERPWISPSASARLWASPSAGARPWTSPSASARPWTSPSASERPWISPSASERPWISSSASERPWTSPSASERPWITPSASARPRISPSASQETRNLFFSKNNGRGNVAMGGKTSGRNMAMAGRTSGRNMAMAVQKPKRIVHEDPFNTTIWPPKPKVAYAPILWNRLGCVVRSSRLVVWVYCRDIGLVQVSPTEIDGRVCLVATVGKWLQLNAVLSEGVWTGERARSVDPLMSFKVMSDPKSTDTRLHVRVQGIGLAMVDARGTVMVWSENMGLLPVLATDVISNGYLSISLSSVFPVDFAAECPDGIGWNVVSLQRHISQDVDVTCFPSLRCLEAETLVNGGLALLNKQYEVVEMLYPPQVSMDRWLPTKARRNLTVLLTSDWMDNVVVVHVFVMDYDDTGIQFQLESSDSGCEADEDFEEIRKKIEKSSDDDTLSWTASGLATDKIEMDLAQGIDCVRINLQQLSPTGKISETKTASVVSQGISAEDAGHAMLTRFANKYGAMGMSRRRRK